MSGKKKRGKAILPATYDERFSIPNVPPGWCKGLYIPYLPLVTIHMESGKISEHINGMDFEIGELDHEWREDIRHPLVVLDGG